MVKTEVVTIGGKNYQHTYSDANKMITRDGDMYEDAIDPIDSDRVYAETDVVIVVDVLVDTSR